MSGFNLQRTNLENQKGFKGVFKQMHTFFPFGILSLKILMMDLTVSKEI